MAKIEAEHSLLKEIIDCLENPSNYQLKYLSNRVKLGKILVARASKNTEAKPKNQQTKEIEEMFKTYSEYLTTLMVVAALTLTISIPWLFTVIEKTSVYDDFFEDETLRYLNNLLVCLMMCASMLSITVLVVAISFHVNLNLVMLTTEDKLWFVSDNYVGICEDLISAAAAFLCSSVPFGIFVSYGKAVAYVCTAIFALNIAFVTAFAINLVAKLRKRLYPEYRQYAREFRQTLDMLVTADAESADEGRNSAPCASK
jgi:hypothetical protein